MKKYLLVFVAFASSTLSFKSNNGGLKIGEIAPHFVMKDINGVEVKLSNYKGKVVLIDFWASWCKQCRAESPKLVKTYQKFHDAKFAVGNGFEIVSISLDDNLEEWRTAVSQDGYIWSNLSEGKKWDAEIAKLYQVSSLPTNYLLDETGKIMAKDLHGAMLDNILMANRK